MSNQYLSFDVTKQSAPQQLITGRQGDSQLKFVSVLLWDGEKNIPYDLTGKQIAFEALKPGGTHIVDYNGITILDAPHGLFRYSFNEQVFSVAGTMQQAFFKITHTDSDNNVIADSTLEVSINILENRVEFGINSKDYLSEYDDLIAQVKKKFDDYAATVQDSLDKAQALHDQIVEYTNLINSKGVILRSEFGDISSIKQPLGQTAVDKLNNEFSDRSINVAWYGAKGDGVNDDTESINRAIIDANSNGGGTVFIPNGTYMIKSHVDGFSGQYLNGEGGIKLLDNVTLYLQNNTVLKAIPTEMGQYNIIQAYGVSNVKILGGSILGDLDEHVGTTGEWGYGIAISGSENVQIRNIKISKCWGDGINIQIIGEEGGTPSKNVLIDNIISTKNRRQGMSVEGVDGLLVSNSEFSETSGTAPQSGVDIEPWSDKNLAHNIIFQNCSFLNNENSGLLALTGAVNNLVIKNNIFKGNKGTTTKNGQLATSFNSTANSIKILNNQFIDDINQSMTLRGGGNYLVSGNEMEQGVLLFQGNDEKMVKGAIFASNSITPTGKITPLWDIVLITGIYDLKLYDNNIDTSNVYNGHSLLMLKNIYDSRVDNNKLINSPRSIVIEDSANIMINENTIDNPGIFAMQLMGNSKDIKIVGNYICGAAHQSQYTAAIRAQDDVMGIELIRNKIYQEPRKTNTSNLGSYVEIYTFQRTDNAGLNTVSFGNKNIWDGVHTKPIFIQQNTPMTSGYTGEAGGGVMAFPSDKLPTEPTDGTL